MINKNDLIFFLYERERLLRKMCLSNLLVSIKMPPVCVIVIPMGKGEWYRKQKKKTKWKYHSCLGKGIHLHLGSQRTQTGRIKTNRSLNYISVKSLKTKDEVSNLKEAREKWHIAYILWSLTKYSEIQMASFLNIQKTEGQRQWAHIFKWGKKLIWYYKSDKHILWK